MYTSHQNKVVAHIKKRVQDLFGEFPVPVHGFDHAQRVAEHAKYIAEKEGKQNIFICEIVGWLHDIGRVPEKYNGRTERHHELSYELLKKWYAEDDVFSFLSIEEKKEILYALRYHWCDGADEYDSALILRDADKLDLLGSIGMERTFEWCSAKSIKIEDDIRNKYYCYYWLRTQTAKKFARENKLMEPVDTYFRELLKKSIEPIEL